MLAAKVPTAAKDDQRNKEDSVGHIICPWIFTHKVLGIVDKGEDGNKGESDQQLHCEDHEDLVGKKSFLKIKYPVLVVNYNSMNNSIQHALFSSNLLF